MAGRRRNVNIGANSIVYSGRGRPRKEAAATASPDAAVTPTRPLPVGIVLGSPSSPAIADLYKNRKIRVGHLFQAKVPKKPSGGDVGDDGEEEESPAYSSSRPAPSKVSWDHPHLTEEQVAEYKHQIVASKEQLFNQEQQEREESTTPIAVDVSQTAAPSSPNTNNPVAHSDLSLSSATRSNISGSLRTTTTDRQQLSDTQHQDDDDDQENDDDFEDELTTQRGGLLLCPADPSALLHKPQCIPTSTTKTRGKSAAAKAMDTTTTVSAEQDFWSFAQPLLLAATTSTKFNPDKGVNNNVTSKIWQSQMLQWNLDKQQRLIQASEKAEEELAQQPKKRGRRKRKKDASVVSLEEQDPIVWYTRHIMGLDTTAAGTANDKGDPADSAVKRQRVTSDHGFLDTDSLQGTHEERLQAMQHLWLRHRGQSAAAKLELMVQLSAGKADFARRVKQHKRRKQRKPDPNQTYSWRQQLSESFITSMTGDFRNSNSAASHKYALSPGGNVESNYNDSTVNGFSGHEEETDVEVQKEIWKSILEFGRTIEEQLAKASTDNSNTAPLPKLSLLLSFLKNAFEVRPIPEDIFRAPSVPPEINTCLNNIMGYINKAKKCEAQLMDLLYETHHSGVDLDALQKLLEQTGRSFAVDLDDASELRNQVNLYVDWQKKLDAILSEDELKLSVLEDLAQKGRSFAFRTKSLVQLDNRMHKAHLLRDRIKEWKRSCDQDEEDLEDKKESVKFLLAMVRDAYRLKLIFPEVSELLETHKSVETWIDRASIAIRSRIALTEIKTLLETGDDLPVDLSDYIEKLRARASQAEEWIEHFSEEVPCPVPLPMADTAPAQNTLLRWMARMRDSLVEGKHSDLHVFASEGSRIPVDIDIVKLLQVELDGRNWTMKARKWIPSLSENAAKCKQGKLEELRDHLEKASGLRDKLVLPPDVRNEWVLEGEKEIFSIVQAADDWFEKYQTYLDWDNRRNQGRSCLSLEKLRTIVKEASAIHANIGSATGKMERILTQAEEWIKEYGVLLVRCKIIEKTEGNPPLPVFVTLPQLTAAAEAAASSVSLDLDEAKALEELVETVKNWSDRVLKAAPKRSQRQGRGRKSRITVDDIIDLIGEASVLPVDTSEDVRRLQIQLSEVQEWRAKARQELEEILNGFTKLRFVVNDIYGPPSEYSRTSDDDFEVSGEDGKNDGNGASVPNEEVLCNTEMEDAEDDGNGSNFAGNGICNVNHLIKNYHTEAKSFGVLSGEVEAADVLEKISIWCVRSLKYLVTQRDIFDKRFFGEFDRFVVAGKELLTASKGESPKLQISLDDKEFEERLNSTWGSFIADQLQRLDVLLADRERFMAWSKNANSVLFSSKDKRPAVEILKDITDQSRDFPSVCDMVQKVRGIYKKSTEWRATTLQLLNNRDEKLNLYEAKTILDEGEKLGFACDELKILRNAYREARSWATRAKKLDIESGTTNANEVQDLIKEHEKLVLELPDELERLEEAMQGYCICRRAYSGFMIGCDECEEWYHGVCIGITESKAERVENYCCVRCCITKTYQSAAREAIGIVRKWTCRKDLKRARQVDAQKHQRKVRKEMKDVEKFQKDILIIKENQLRADAPTTKKSQLPASTSKAVITEAKAVESSETMVKDSGEAIVEQLARAETPTISRPIENHLGSAQGGVTADYAMEDRAQNDNAEVELNSVTASSAATPAKCAQEAPKAAMKPKKAAKFLTREEAKAKIAKLTTKIAASKDKLAVLAVEGEKRKGIFADEDSKASYLRLWCLRVCTLVLAPKTEEGAELSRPNIEDGTLSWAMQRTMEEARMLRIFETADVQASLNCFRCMSWCILATRYLARKPTFDEIEFLMNMAENIDFPEEKALRMIKNMYGRAKSWQVKVYKELAPVAGEKKGFNVSSLEEIEAACEDIPMRMKEESLVAGVIEDKGARHCVCGGPTDARFMLSCDVCEKWFHGPCVRVSKHESECIEKWSCPLCSGKPTNINIAARGIVCHELKVRSKPNISTEAPDASTMWPPFGLFHSALAQEVLGDKCSGIADVTDADIAALARQSDEIQKQLIQQPQRPAVVPFFVQKPLLATAAAPTETSATEHPSQVEIMTVKDVSPDDGEPASSKCASVAFHTEDTHTRSESESEGVPASELAEQEAGAQPEIPAATELAGAIEMDTKFASREESQPISLEAIAAEEISSSADAMEIDDINQATKRAKTSPFAMEAETSAEVERDSQEKPENAISGDDNVLAAFSRAQDAETAAAQTGKSSNPGKEDPASLVQEEVENGHARASAEMLLNATVSLNAAHEDEKEVPDEPMSEAPKSSISGMPAFSASDLGISDTTENKTDVSEGAGEYGKPEFESTSSPSVPTATALSTDSVDQNGCNTNAETSDNTMEKLTPLPLPQLNSPENAMKFMVPALPVQDGSS